MKKILIVEDEFETASFLKNHLEKLEFNVDVACDGKSAIDKIKSFIPDLIILDIILPQLDGLAVLKWVRENNIRVYVILTTVKQDVEDLKRGYSLEADYYITKPYGIEEVLKGINIMFSLNKE